MDPTWELVLKFATILVPMFMTIIMVGVGYIVRLVGGLRADVTELMVKEAAFKTALDERRDAAARDHAIIDRRLDEHDEVLERHGERLQSLEYWRGKA